MKQNYRPLGDSRRRVCAVFMSALVTGVCFTFGTASGAEFAYDPGFGSEGKGVVQVFEKGSISAMLPRQDGGITVAGKARSDDPDNPKNSFYVGVLKANGSPVVNFGNHGRVETPFPTVWGRATGIAHAPSSTFYAVGNFRGESGPWKPLVYRFHLDGSVDDAFHTYTGEDRSTNHQKVSDVAVDQQGRAVVIGNIWRKPNRKRSILVMRFESGGKLDRTFGHYGKVELPAKRPGYVDGSRIIPLAGGRILIGGALGGYPFVARLNDDGSLDRTFGIGGIATFARGPGNRCRFQYPCQFTDMVRTPDGDIRVMANFSYHLDNWIPSIVGLFPNGRIDSDFGYQGRRTVRDWGTGSPGGRKLTAMDDSSLIMVDEIGATDLQSRAYRVTQSGNFDPDFGTGGSLKLAGNYTYGVTALPNGGFAVASARGGWIKAGIIQKFNPVP